ncbi:NAD-dependent epimerase/dehydratase family protein [Pleomorphochaeta sp. DL1XJH-081]|uniref:NAD-dependent epimerase/dehydratase family protein n=1 Tax=Pleomorphochaeta sp. DL1XJH-081 TaxID=3409690 RepID=UPI003BB5CD2D
MHIVVLGGTGHIGSFAVPRLIQAGHSVTVVSRGNRDPYFTHVAWKKVKRLSIDRERAETEGTFGKQIADLKGDVIIDLICFTQESGEQLVEELRGKITHLLMCGTVWINGISRTVPFTEESLREPFGDYGINKAKLTNYLLYEARTNNFPVTVFHPGHIVGPGWIPLNPQGNFNIEVWKAIKAGKQLLLPNQGMETVHHVHADDVASVCIGAMENRSVSIGESFLALSSGAVTLRGFAEAAFRWFGHEPNLKFACWEDFKKRVSEEDAWFTDDHISRSPCGSIEKAKRLLQYSPRYTSLQAVFESVMHLQREGII